MRTVIAKEAFITLAAATKPALARYISGLCDFTRPVARTDAAISTVLWTAGIAVEVHKSVLAFTGCAYNAIFMLLLCALAYA
jgi:hypothetical protein